MEANRIELSEHELSKIALLMAKDINSNIDAHLTEALETHRIKLKEEFVTIHDSHASEVCAVLDLQNDIIRKIQSDQIDLRNEMDTFKEAYPVMGMYISVTKKIKLSLRRVLIWGTVGVIILLLSFKIIKYYD